MPDKINNKLPAMAILPGRSNRFGGMILGITFLTLAMACIGAACWTPDLAVWAGTTLLSMSLAASGVIAVLAGDP